MMQRSTLLALRRQAKAQLVDYRRNQARLNAQALCGAEREAAEGWGRAIACARATLEGLDPYKARVLVRLFGLENPIPRYQKLRARIVRLCMECSVSESTLYRWRDEMIQLVLLAAIEAGVVRPFGLEAGGAAQAGPAETATTR